MTRIFTKLRLASGLALVAGLLAFAAAAEETAVADAPIADPAPEPAPNPVPDPVTGPLIEVPSGQQVSYIDTVQAVPGPGGLTIRFRFLAPAIAREGGTVDADIAQTDMQSLCESFALPRLPTSGPIPSQIIISLADHAVPFGEASPEITQFFEAYSVVDGHCHWEVF